jgi:hypothetical protein
MLAAISLVGGLILGCGGGDDETRQPEATGSPAAAVDVVFDGTSCEYRGPDAVPAGTVSIQVSNETDAGGFMGLWGLAEGTAFEDFSAFYSDQPVPAELDLVSLERIEAFSGVARLVTSTAGVGVDPASDLTLRPPLTSGVYVAECAAPGAGPFISGPIVVE